jgi:hypothetical protein
MTTKTMSRTKATRKTNVTKNHTATDPLTGAMFAIISCDVCGQRLPEVIYAPPMGRDPQDSSANNFIAVCRSCAPSFEQDEAAIKRVLSAALMRDRLLREEAADAYQH